MDVWFDAEPDPVAHEFGPWSFELRAGGSLSNLTFRGTPVLRAVRPVLRDRDWRTAPATVHEVSVGQGLRITGEFVDAAGEDDVRADWTLEVTAGDEFAVEFTATARTSFARNRFGLVVLHRPDEAGNSFTITHPDATSTGAWFPREIAPHQPAQDIVGLAWSRSGVCVALEFSGDVFEMEDQRNWTDASYKTYSTPLSEPFPVPLSVGETVRQRISVRCEGAGTDAVVEETSGLELAPTGRVWPRWGTDAPLGGFDGPLLTELVLPDPGWREHLARAVATGRELDVRLITDDPTDLREATELLRDVRLLRVGVHSLTRHVSLPELWEALRGSGLEASFVAGARSHFTELNRTVDLLPADADAVVFSSTPQMHDTGRDQVIEALQIQPLTAAQAVRIAGGRPVHVGPVTLRARFNAVATTSWRPDRDVGIRDPRVDSPGFAAWVVASAAAFAVDGVETVVFGDVDGAAGPVLRRLQEFSGLQRLDPMGVAPQGVHVVAGTSADELRVLLANLADSTRRVVIDGSEFILEPGTVTEHVRPL